MVKEINRDRRRKASNRRRDRLRTRQSKKSQAIVRLDDYRNYSEDTLDPYSSYRNNLITTSPTTQSRRRRSSPSLAKRKTHNFRRQRQRSSPLLNSLVYLIRLLILGVGIAGIAGTALYFFDSTQGMRAEDAATPEINAEAEEDTQNFSDRLKPPLVLGRELTDLTAQIEALSAQNAQLQPGFFFVDLDTGAYVDINAEQSFAAASTIKIPILVAFLQEVDRGTIRLDEKLTMTEGVKAGGSGNMQYSKVGTQYTALETATRMIYISDNTATNMIIERLGGQEAVNRYFQQWDLHETAIRNPLPDLEGTNTTSPRDLANLLALVNKGDLISLRSRDRFLGIMEKTVTKTLLPKGLGSEATIAHKTGDIGTMLGDAGIVDMPNGKRYLGVAMVKRPHNDYSARTLIQQVSKSVYQQFNRAIEPQVERSVSSDNERVIDTLPQ